MRIYSKLKPNELENIIKLIPNVKRTSRNSAGYEIPEHKGRVHIIFSSEGLEIHRDREKNKKHIVMHGSKTAKEIHERLSFAISVWETINNFAGI